jgi:TfoX/Sxy family transcriptional regulator of competence genes
MERAARPMPNFSKSPPELVARFDWLAGRFPRERFPNVERRKMFGYPALFVGGNLCTGLFASSWMIRLPDEVRGELQAIPGSGPFEPMPGKPMKGYALVPESVLADDASLEGWVRRAVDYVGTLQPKK